MPWKPALVAVVACVLSLSRCGGTAGSNANPAAGPSGGSPGQGSPLATHVAVVVLENTSYAAVIGSSKMPYLNSLASQYGLATNYFANTHPSIGNYFMMTTGQIVTNNDAFSGAVSADNLVRELNNAGKSWKAYAESIPARGYTGGNVFPYLRRHVPFTYFSDVVNNSAQAANIVPVTQLAADVQSGQLPDLLFITPDATNDMHSCPTSNPSCTLVDLETRADAWLSANIAPLLSSSAFQGGLLIITFDEAFSDDVRGGGGQVVCIVAGPAAKTGFRSGTFYQHQNLLALIARALGLSTAPGAAAGANAMTEFLR